MGQLFINNCSSRLTAAINASATSIGVTAGDGARFAAAGTLSTTNYLIGTLVKVSGYREVAWEIVKITGRSTDTLTIVRAQEGTTALSFSAGDVIDIRLTAAGVNEQNTYTPTVSAYSGTITTASATGRYTRIGRLWMVHVDITITTNGTGAGIVKVTLPATAAGHAIGAGIDAGTGDALTCQAATGEAMLYVRKYDHTYPGGDAKTLRCTVVFDS